MNKYFESIPGQSKALDILTKLFETKRIPHALLFYGPEGCGKFFTAIQFLKLLNKSADFSSIEKKINSLSEPLLKYILPLPRGKGEGSDDSALDKLTEKQIEIYREEIKMKAANPYYKIKLEGANTIKISSIREIRKFLSLDYSDIDYRMVLIEDAHQMNAESQNALLKNLEEPPEGVIFVLTTSNAESLLPTIQSRCWQVKFNHLSQKDVLDNLIGYYNVDEKDAKIAAVFSGGSVTRAIDLLNNDLRDLMDSTIKILRFSLGNWFNSAILESQKIIDTYDRETYKEMLNLILIWFNDVVKNRIDFDNYYFYDYADTLRKFNERYSDCEISGIYQEIDRLRQSMDNNVLLNVISLNLILQLNSIARR